VPNVIGITERSVVKRPGAWIDVSAAIVNQIIESAWSGEAAAVARSIAEWASARNISTQWRDGPFAGLGFSAKAGRSKMLLFSYKTIDHLTIEMLGTFKTTHRPFDSDEARVGLIDQLNSIPGVNIGREQTRAFPGFDRKLLHDPSILEQLLNAFDWVLVELRSHQ